MPVLPPEPGSSTGVGADLGTFLLENSNVAALVGDQIWMGFAPENATYPLLNYSLISAPRVDATTDTGGIVDARWSFSGYAKGQDGPVIARQITDAVKDALLLFRGLLTATGSYVEVPAVDDERGPEYNPDAQVWRCDLDLIISYPD